MFKKTGRMGVVLCSLILIILVVFAGCPARESEPAGRAAASVDVRGANITVSSWWSTYNVDTFEPRSESEELELNYRYNLLRDQGFNFQVMELADWDNYLPAVINNIMAGNRDIHIYEVAAPMAITLYKQGLLFPVGNSRAVNFNNREMVAAGQPGATPMYNGLVQDFMTFNGVQYGWQYGLPNNSWGQAMLFFNTEHLTAVGLSPDYIYDLQRDNNWTWDTFLDLCRRLTRDINNDGITDIYAIHCDDAREFIKGLIYGNGGNFVTFDAQGRASSSVNSPAVIEAMNFYNQLINEGLVMTAETYDWGQNWTAFYDQRVAMTFDPEWRKGQADQFEGGYVLPPRGPRSSQLRMDAIDNVYVIPNIFSAEEVDVILKAAEMWFTPTDTDWLQGHYWASRNLRDVTETVAMSRDARFLTLRDFFLIPGYPFDEFIEEFRNGLGTVNPSQIIEAWTPRFNAAIEDFNR